MVYMEIKKVLLCVDMQLYVVTKQVYWNQHIIQSFLGCIGTSIKGSALKLYITRNKRYFQWEILVESYESVSECSSCTITPISVKWTIYSIGFDYTCSLVSSHVSTFSMVSMFLLNYKIIFFQT